MGVLEKVGLKVNFENWQNLDKGVFLGRELVRVSPVGEIDAERDCAITLDELGRADKQRNSKPDKVLARQLSWLERHPNTPRL